MSDVADVQSCLQHISPDLPRFDWFKVLTGIKATGLPDAREIARDWSAGSGKFEEPAFNSTWDSIEGGYSSAFLFSIGKQHGYIKRDGQKKRVVPAVHQPDEHREKGKSQLQPRQVKALYYGAGPVEYLYKCLDLEIHVKGKKIRCCRAFKDLATFNKAKRDLLELYSDAKGVSMARLRAHAPSYNAALEVIG